MLVFFKHKLLHPLLAFIRHSRSIGIILLCCTVISLLLSNYTATSRAYTAIWQQPFSQANEHYFQFYFLHLPNNLLTVINDFLMTIFFFMAGMEIKREMLQGELSSVKKSILPIAAAIGGMLFPAILFTLCNKCTVYQSGWAIPTATDIAFTLGIASLLGKRVPVNLKIFLTALAIIDDLGAIIIIAFFYGGAIHYMYLASATAIIIALFILNKKRIQFGWLHVLLGAMLWYAMFCSGIHATVAGVAFAMLVPVNFLHRLELKLHTLVYFFVLPLFALANTAIVLPEGFSAAITSSLSWGILLGLCIGKPIGIFITSYFLVKRKWALLPAGVSYKMLLGGGMLAGIGFTMSIFISTLAFQDSVTQDIGKVSTLIASLVASILGSILFYLNKERKIKGNI